MNIGSVWGLEAASNAAPVTVRRDGAFRIIDRDVSVLTLDHVNYVDVAVRGNVGSVVIDGPADFNSVTIHGYVGSLVNYDGWYNQLDIAGNIGYAEVINTIGTDLSAWSVDWLVISDSRGIEIDVGYVGGFRFDGVDDSSIDIGFTFGGGLQGEDNDLDIGYLFGYLSMVGEDNDLHLGGGFGQLFVEGEGSSIEVEDFDGLIRTGEGIFFEVEDSTVQIDLGADNFFEAIDSSVFGEVGEDSVVFIDDTRAILELAGRNYVGMNGGQLLINAQNGEVDTFRFTGGALVDGKFDSFDQVTLGSGANWSMDELAAAFAGDEIELPGDVVMSADVPDSDWLMAA
jgi:hypothetical protein